MKSLSLEEPVSFEFSYFEHPLFLFVLGVSSDISFLTCPSLLVTSPKYLECHFVVLHLFFQPQFCNYKPPLWLTLWQGIYIFWTIVYFFPFFALFLCQTIILRWWGASFLHVFVWNNSKKNSNINCNLNNVLSATSIQLLSCWNDECNYIGILTFLMLH